MAWQCAFHSLSFYGVDGCVSHGVVDGDSSDACRRAYRHFFETNAMSLDDDASLQDGVQCRLSESHCRDVTRAAAREVVVAGDEIASKTLVANGEFHLGAPVAKEQLYVVVIVVFLGV